MADQQPGTWLDRAVGWLAPRAGLHRLRARVASDLLLRHYEGAAAGRRTQGWQRSSADANAAVVGGLAALRDHARDLVRNNPHAESALQTITDHVVGWGIVGKPRPANARAAEVWKAWAGTTACDAEGRHDFAGLQKLVMRTVVEAGECLIRRRNRLLTDGLPLPLQLQVLEPDYLDTLRTGIRLPNGGRIINGVEFDAIGRRVAYWLFPEHPGALMSMFTAGSLGGASVRVNAENVLHVFHQKRPGQVRGVSWFAPVILKMKDFDEYEDAQLMKQKIAACLAIFTTDIDGTAAPLGVKDATVSPETDSLEPGAIINAPAGRSITVVDPPRVGEYGVYSEITLRAIATGLGVSYEDLTGDFSDMPFSAARMSRLAHWDRVEDWRWDVLIPHLCEPTWKWAMQAASILGMVPEQWPAARWTAPPPPMIEPDKEGLGIQRNIRTGITTLSESIRERGYDPDELLAELAADFEKLDELGITLDSDPRRRTQAGQPITEGTGEPAQPDEPEPDNANAARAVALVAKRRASRNGKSRKVAMRGEAR